MINMKMYRKLGKFPMAMDLTQLVALIISGRPSDGLYFQSSQKITLLISLQFFQLSKWQFGLSKNTEDIANNLEINILKTEKLCSRFCYDQIT